MSTNTTSPLTLESINTQFLNNREAALKSLMQGGEPYIAGQADALGISYAQAAKLVAHGIASILRSIALEQLAKLSEQAAMTKESSSGLPQ